MQTTITEMANETEGQNAKNKIQRKQERRRQKVTCVVTNNHFITNKEGSRGTSTTPHMGTHPVILQGQNGPVKTLHYERDDRSVVTSHDATFQLSTHVPSDTSSDT